MKLSILAFTAAAALAPALSSAEVISCYGYARQNDQRITIGSLTSEGKIKAVEVDIDSNQTFDSEEDPSEYWLGHIVVFSGDTYKVTAKRSINPEQDMVLELWNSEAGGLDVITRMAFASGSTHVSLGHFTRDFEIQLNCYPKDIFDKKQEPPAETTPTEPIPTEPPDQTQEPSPPDQTPLPSL